MRCNCARIVAMFSRVHTAGWVLPAIAAFSAGSPNASHPIGCKTLLPWARR